MVFDSLLLIHYQVAHWRTAPSAKTTSIRVRKMTHTQSWTAFFDRRVQKYFMSQVPFFISLFRTCYSKFLLCFVNDDVIIKSFLRVSFPINPDRFCSNLAGVLNVELEQRPM